MFRLMGFVNCLKGLVRGDWPLSQRGILHCNVCKDTATHFRANDKRQGGRLGRKSDHSKAHKVIEVRLGYFVRLFR